MGYKILIGSLGHAINKAFKNEMPGLPKEMWSIVKYPRNSTINIPKLLNEKLIRATGVGTLKPKNF